MKDLLTLKTMLTISTVMLAVVAVLLIVITILWLREHWKRKEAEARTLEAIKQAGDMAFLAAEWKKAARDKTYNDELEERYKQKRKNSPIIIIDEFASQKPSEEVKP